MEAESKLDARDAPSPHLTRFVALQRDREEKVKANEHICTVIKVARDEDLASQIGKDIYFDLVDYDKVKQFRFPKQLPFSLFKIPESPKFNVSFSLNVIKGGGPKAQFYLMDIDGCWKNDGRPCDGDVTSDVTRYSEIDDPQPPDLPLVLPRRPLLLPPPPLHTFRNGTSVHRRDAARFPYAAYHVYCSPGNAAHLHTPYNLCDPFSNPQAQEIVQILPHPVWGEYGYPTIKGEGWVGQGPRTWELDVGGLSHNLYFYQDPGSTRARRLWTSINVGVEIYRDPNQEAEWTLSDFDIRVPKGTTTN